MLGPADQLPFRLTTVSPLPDSLGRTRQRAGSGRNSLACDDLRRIWPPSFGDLRLAGRSVNLTPRSSPVAATV